MHLDHHWDIERAIGRSPGSRCWPYAVRFLTKGGVDRIHAYRPTLEWATALAHDLTDNGYPARLYYVRYRRQR